MKFSMTAEEFCANIADIKTINADDLTGNPCEVFCKMFPENGNYVTDKIKSYIPEFKSNNRITIEFLCAVDRIKKIANAEEFTDYEKVGYIFTTLLRALENLEETK